MLRTAARLMQGATPLLLLLHAAMVVSFFAYGRYEREPLHTALCAVRLTVLVLVLLPFLVSSFVS